MNRMFLLLCGLTLVSCEQASGPTRPSLAVDGSAAFGASPQGVVASATGGGHYLLLGTEDVQFAFSAIEQAGERASGQLHHKLTLEGQEVEFHGEVTCVTVDPVNHRAWIGGVVTQNRSEHPSFTTPIHQPGRDIWFRVLDNGEGHADPDRTTFVGFEGAAGIRTSAEYCAVKPWPAGNARTWPVTRGNIQVRP